MSAHTSASLSRQVSKVSDGIVRCVHYLSGNNVILMMIVTISHFQPHRRDYSDSRRYERPSYDSPQNYSYSSRSRTHSDERNVRVSRHDSRDRSRDRGYERDRSPMRREAKDIYVDDCYTKHVIGSKGSQIAKIRFVVDLTFQNNYHQIRPGFITFCIYLTNFE